jgi:hypothetical protein
LLKEFWPFAVIIHFISGNNLRRTKIEGNFQRKPPAGREMNIRKSVNGENCFYEKSRAAEIEFSLEIIRSPTCDRSSGEKCRKLSWKIPGNLIDLLGSLQLS